MRDSGIVVSSPIGMTAVLTPERALDLLALLSADVRGGAVVDATGTLLAGDPALAVAARDPRRPREGCVAVASGGHGVAVALGGHAVAALVLHDVAAALEALAP
jgi:hypothetical protein